MREAGMTQQAIAEKVGISERQARRIEKEPDTAIAEKEKRPVRPKRQNVYLHEDPARAAAQIIAKYGARYALELADALVTEVGTPTRVARGRLKLLDV